MRTALIVDTNKFINNIKSIKQKLPECVKLLAVVKADGYGHGAIPLSNIAKNEGVEYFGVATINEAIELREGGLEKDILILAEPVDCKRIHLIAYYNISLMVYSENFLQELINAPNIIQRKIKIHLKVDTGMHRLGIAPDKAVFFAKKIISSANLELEGLATHFANADNEDSFFCSKQISLFEKIIFDLSKEGIDIPIKHACNSAGLNNSLKPYYDMVRVGIDLYKGVMSFTAKVLLVKDVFKGDYVGYDLTFQATENTRIAVVSVGYADGYSRLLSNKGTVIIKGQKCPIIGNVCMDMIMVSLPNWLNVMQGEDVILIGKQGAVEISVEDVASNIGTINYEVMTSIGKRVQRIYKH
jgi:alanine racemase